MEDQSRRDRTPRSLSPRIRSRCTRRQSRRSNPRRGVGQGQARIEAKDSNPTAIGVFPKKAIAEKFTRTQIVFGTPRGYFVKSWAEGKLADTIGTIETSTVDERCKAAGRGGRAFGRRSSGAQRDHDWSCRCDRGCGGHKGKNVLWAYVCGDYEKGSPGNRVMPGHTATVVSAAWAKEGGTAVTGDADGRVIVWDTEDDERIPSPGTRRSCCGSGNFRRRHPRGRLRPRQTG